MSGTVPAEYDVRSRREEYGRTPVGALDDRQSDRDGLGGSDERRLACWRPRGSCGRNSLCGWMQL